MPIERGLCFHRWAKMAILMTCIVILLQLAKSKAASRPEFNITVCTLVTKQPRNSLVSCSFDRKLGGYTNCIYVCRAGYYFEGRVNDVGKIQICINGIWLFGNPGNCLPPKEEISTVPCLSKPRSPKNSFNSCTFSKRLMKYTKCKFTCRKGYFFKDGTDEKASFCRNESWLPMNHGHCSADCARTATPNSTMNSCSSRPQRPLNSYDYCIFDKETQGYVKCNYYCRRGYHFYSNVSRLKQYCHGGSWKSRKARDCVKEKIQGPPCWEKIDGPENSFTYCQIDMNSEGYTWCRYACKAGYFFQRDVYWKTRFCINGEWTPDNIGKCVNQLEEDRNKVYGCSIPAKFPRRASTKCQWDMNIRMRTSCTSTCYDGYYFMDMMRVRIQKCEPGGWNPSRIENCEELEVVQGLRPPEPTIERGDFF